MADSVKGADLTPHADAIYARYPDLETGRRNYDLLVRVVIELAWSQGHVAGREATHNELRARLAESAESD